MLTMRGPQFLLFFTLIAICAYVALGFLVAARERERWPGNQRVRDPYAIAFLRGGTSELVQVVALALLLRGLLKVELSYLKTVNPSDVERVAPPVEKAVLKACATPIKPTSIAANAGVSVAANGYERDLEAMQLLADGEVRRARTGPVLLVIALLCGLAVMKILVAIATGHTNVFFLVFVAFLASVWMLMRITKRRTSAGDAALKNLTSLFSSLRRRRRYFPTNTVTDATMLAAVFGIYLLPDVSRASWAKLFAKPADSGSSSSNSCGSSCGGGSGCGGGGCGGCGS
jgi:uncharacterized protein (TIGR04222 family)